MEINYMAVLVATIVQFIIGFIWYMPLFGKLWGRMHGFDTLSPEAQKEAQSKMMPLLVTQFLVTIVTSTVLAMFMYALKGMWNVYGIAVFAWLGFVLPTQISAVIFGGTKPEWVMKKIAVASLGSLVCLVVAAAIISMM
jgi:hypothetical protein